MDIAYLAHGILGDQAEAERDFNVAAQIIYTNFMAPVSLLTWLAKLLRPTPRRHSRRHLLGSRRPRPQIQLPYGSSKAGLSAFLAGLRNESTARASPSSPSSPAPPAPP